MDKISFDFKNRTALVTGGAQGFGLDIAKRFLKSGAKVIIWDIDSKMIEQAIKELIPSLLCVLISIPAWKCVPRNSAKVPDSCMGISTGDW